MTPNVNSTKRTSSTTAETTPANLVFFTNYLELTKSQDLIPNHNPHINKIKKLVHNLAQVANISQVRAIALQFPDIHWIDFELELRTGTELSDITWANIQDSIIDYEWELRRNSGEKWYFDTAAVKSFSILREGSRVIADSCGVKTRDMSFTSSSLKLSLFN